MSNYVVIVSHKSYSKAREALFESLKLSKWPLDKVIVVLNNEEHDEIADTCDGYKVWRCMSNIFEYTGFLLPRAINARPDDAFLLLHDTCKAREEFAVRATAMFERFRQENVDIYWASADGQSNICVFNLRASEAAYAQWSSTLTMPKWEAVQIEVQHSHVQSMKNKRKKLKQLFFEKSNENSQPEDVYDSGVKRHVLYVPALDLNKYFYYVKGHREVHPSIP